MSAFTPTEFDRWMNDFAALVDGKWFYGRVAGTDRVNENGTSRQAAIGSLQPQDELRLEHEADNAFDPNAMKVLASDGTQVGYLESRLAGETVRRLKKGTDTRVFVSNLSGAPGQRRGLVIGILTHKKA